MRRKLKNYLLIEEKTKMKELHNKIAKFFMDNPKPSDKEVHAFAEELGMDEHKFEEHIYMMLGELLKKDKVNEMISLHPMDIKNIEDIDEQILRFSMMAELDAASAYIQMASIARNPDVKETLLDVAYEEKVHAGEFEDLLEGLDDEYEEAEEEGEEEVEDME